MKNKTIVTGSDVITKLASGVQKLTEVVATTMGPFGKLVVIEGLDGTPIVTKDGVTVARSVKLADKHEDMGVQLALQTCNKSLREVGDGTTTTLVLANAFIQHGLNLEHKEQTRSLLDNLALHVKGRLRGEAKRCKTTKMAYKIATISANGDKSIADIVTKALDAVGKNGVVTVDESNLPEDSLQIVKGMRLERGFMSPYFATDATKQISELDNPAIAILHGKLTNIKDLLPLLEEAAKAGSSILLIAEDIDQNILTPLVVNHVKGIIRICCVKAPISQGNPLDELEDIAIATGGKVLNHPNGQSFLVNAKLDELGRAGKVIVNADTTTIIDGKCEKLAVSERVEQLQDYIKNTPEDPKKLYFRGRIAKLDGGVAIIKVGGLTEAAMKERLDRMDDALAATRAAIEEGYIDGFGIPLAKLSEELKANPFAKALAEPHHQLIKNSNYKVNDSVKARIDVYDPVKVTCVALDGAVSIAALILSSGGLVTEEVG